MHSSTLRLCLLGLAAHTFASAQPVSSRAAPACFIVGNTTLPAEVSEAAAKIQNSITCNPAVKTIGNVPDVIENDTTFSSIDFSTSSLTPLEFALQNFATEDVLASSDLALFQTRLDLYIATETGVRSEDGNLAIKEPKFFLAFQVARIKTAQGVKITDPGQTVDHLLGKVQKNADSKDKANLDQVVALSKKLS